ncbi:hypothetical protein [Usitatibacter palustris]|uniref:Uncharacterized protein n=1 Tax=Usitatibacter palustris TaxID=2732487 RepID=A0A6M4H594_9PROT|nr:hypothetical protein [Usitatibacter palustris]QJR14325.1 hypothetical protein DSM104440_01121 [Usitatibacter palustris]
MKQRTVLIAITAAGLLGAAGLGIGASATSEPSLMSRSDYQSLRDAIAKTTADDFAACETMKPVARGECLAEARASESVQLAELEVRYRGTVSAANNVHLARIDAAYQVARSKCFLLSGAGRDNCLIAAHAQKAHARMQAHAEINEAPVVARTHDRREG